MKDELKQCFDELGVAALVTVTEGVGSSYVNVLRDEMGEFFDIQYSRKSQPRVFDCDPDDRHLLLGFGDQWHEESVFLCGHDERFWFAAAVPEKARVKDIAAAKDALKPPEVWEAIRENNVPSEERNLRKTAAFVRQGEWFFIPRAGLSFGPDEIVADAPLSRGEGKPHVCQFLHRTALPQLFVNRWHPRGLTFGQVKSLPPNERYDQWRRVQRKPRVHVRGAVMHPDHATVFLPTWHQAVANTENDARGMQAGQFFDVRFPRLRFRD
ncbi:MAG TPA: hypothetical protein VFE47_15315 [Tepidisphaeraceae bacterium]|nr:hypothetical protein [Tepidisphaeraceae bacterium]